VKSADLRAPLSERQRWFRARVARRVVLFVRNFRGPVHGLPAALALLLLLPPQRVFSQEHQGTAAEYQTKATFLTTFPTFIDWPDDAFSSLQAPLVICVRGDFTFGTSLAERARGETPHGRRMDVRWVHKDQDLRACHIAFISRSEFKRYAEILQALEGAHTLTVGETPNFLEAGGILAFVFRGESLRFEINLASATAAQLRISSHLLALAIRVVNQTEAAKSHADLVSAGEEGLPESETDGCPSGPSPHFPAGSEESSSHILQEPL
jgi:YfiR/HmsC-like